jgi:hypothetical protein
MTDDQKSRVRLADAIKELRVEISRARQEGQGQDVRFRAKSIEVELSIDFEMSGEGSAGVPKWIPFVDVSVKGSAKRSSAHKIVIKLEIDETGNPAGNLIGDPTGPGPTVDENEPARTVPSPSPE